MQYVDLMRPIIQRAGDLVMSHFRSSLVIRYKNDGSIQTNVDVLVQDFLIAELSKILPNSGCIAEELMVQNRAEYTWVIDPIDGTKNFVRGIPYFCINVALMYGSDVIAAVTYQPVIKEWFYAQKGCGAWLNGVRLTIDSQAYQQAGALMVVSESLLRDFDIIYKVRQQLKHLEYGVRFRMCGAAALDLAYVAAGALDVVVAANLAWWDVAAGVLLIAEAGGAVLQHDGSPVDERFKSLIAGNSELCKLVRSVLL